MSPSFVVKEIEICAIQISVSYAHFIVMCIYRSPAGNFNQFLNFLDAALKHLYKPKMEFLLCGDLNVNYLTDRNCKFELPLLLQTYMSHSVDFPNRIN